jgi:hypothetical protein
MCKNKKPAVRRIPWGRVGHHWAGGRAAEPDPEGEAAGGSEEGGQAQDSVRRRHRHATRQVSSPTPSLCNSD